MADGYAPTAEFIYKCQRWLLDGNILHLSSCMLQSDTFISAGCILILKNFPAGGGFDINSLHTN
jgi:hypothetical protein